ASRKKGLSLEEKRAKMLELFYESQEFFQMKELEKIAPKQKGVIAQSVKEVTQSLVDDGLVECEKIGTFVCYWAFPSKALQTRKRKLKELEESVCDLEAKIKEGTAQLKELKKGKEVVLSRFSYGC
ncbi:Mnd1 family protein, partial [Teladorsagia circumcincta]